MQGGELVSRAVVVHHQIVHSQHAGIGEHLLLDVVHQILAGAFAQQRAERIHHKAPAGDQDERRHAYTHQAIQHIPAGHAAQHRCNEHRAGAQHIVAAVRSSGNEGLGADDTPDGAVEAAHPQLDEDGCDQHGHREPAEHHRGGVQHLDHRFLQQRKADAENGHADYQPRQIFIPGMAEGMLCVRGLAGQLEAHQTDHVGRGIRQVVQGICHDGNRAEQSAYGQLAQTQQQVACHAHPAGKVAVGGAHLRVLRMVGLADEKTNQKLSHNGPPWAALDTCIPCHRL